MLGSIIDIFFPPVCPVCEKALKDKGKSLCGDCEAGFSRLRIIAPVCGVCGAPFASETGGEHTCGLCLAERPPFTKARSVYFYEGPVLTAIHKFKYNGHVILAQAFAGIFEDAAADCPAPDIIVPVPLHINRLKKRGFNQSLLIARKMSKTLKTGLSYDNLARTRATEPQVNLKASERAKNVSSAFFIRAPAAFKGKRILLVDDVYTTGATIRECSKVLKKAGAEVYALTLARAVKL